MSVEQKPPRCRCCLYCYPWGGRILDGMKITEGECRRFPPVVVMRYPIAADDKTTIWGFPQVNLNETKLEFYCGEFKAKEE